ncbi:MAG: ABC transporter ATP-binding protein [Gemmatimonadetes bacterium]|nr:ABC transporter ATP-binding protein [Gemmatimonadota bacterium]
MTSEAAPAAGATTPVLAVRDLKIAFAGRPVLDGLTFEVASGEVYGLLGPNGAGKTTCINIICGLLGADAGSVRVAGLAPGAGARREIGVVPQEIALYRQLTCMENLLFFAGAHDVAEESRRERAERCLEAVQLGDRADDLVATLSGGMHRRLNVAVGLVHEPLLLILDEPTVGLDLEARQLSWELIETLRRTGTTILLTTHYLEEAEALCTRIGIMAGGRLAAEGEMAELRGRIPAAELGVIHAENPGEIERRAEGLGFEYRTAGDAVTVWLPERRRLEQVAEDFAGLSVRSLSVRPVGLEQIYQEVTAVSGRLAV